MKIGYIIIYQTYPDPHTKYYYKGQIYEWPLDQCDKNFVRGQRNFEQIISERVNTKMNLHLIFSQLNPTCIKGQVFHWLAGTQKIFTSTFEDGNWLEEPVSVWGNYLLWT